MHPAAIVHGDCRDVLPTLAAGSVNAIITDPPYPEIDRDYGRLTEDQWWSLMVAVVAEARRLLAPDGSAVFILQANQERIGRMRPWLFEFMTWIAKDWNLIQDAWWWNPAALPRAGATAHGLLKASVKACVWAGAPDAYRNQEAVLWQPAQDVTARDREDRAVYRSNGGGSVIKKRMYDAVARRGGTVPFNLIPIGNGQSAGAAGVAHGASTPLALCRWWVQYLTRPGDLVLDPFSGSGSVPLVARDLGRRAIGIESHEPYVGPSRARVNEGVSHA